MKRPLRALAPLPLVAALALACTGGGNSSSPTAPATPDPPPPPPSPPAATASYRVTFDAVWSAATHPVPANPHFSRLIGGTHDDQVGVWGEGFTASRGIEAMAEQGATSPLDSEVESLIAGGHGEFVLRGDAIGRSPGTTALEFAVSLEKPLVSLVSMVAPSPDWFVGVTSLSLLEGGQWVEEKVVDLYPWDAGTDDGTDFASPDADTRPRQPISAIDSAPLGGTTALGTFTFRRIG